MHSIIIGLDIAKSVFQLHAENASNRVVFRKRLRRTALEAFLTAPPPAVIGIEACGSSHHWARRLSQQGHAVRLSALTACRCIGPRRGPIPAEYAKPFACPRT